MIGAAPRRIPILLYHSVCDDPAPLLAEWSVTPARFGEHLRALSDVGFETLTVSEHVERLRRGAGLPERLVLVTFDDGFADFAANAAPALDAAGMRSTLYVSTAYLGGPSSWLGPEGEQPMLGAAAVRDLPPAVEVGAHAHHHVALDALHPVEAAHEVRTSRDLLEGLLGTPVRSFAYPHGYHSRRIQDIVRTAGFESACAVKHAASSTEDDVYGLAWIIVGPDLSGRALLELMTTIDPAPRREHLRTTAWRWARRARARRPFRGRVPAGRP